MAPSTTIRRLLKEVAELSPNSANPNPAFYAAPVSDSNLHEWHFTLLGPPAPSPYAGGLYHGRISLPAQYPLKPPNFRFLTASGRFEVNREICLSISGFHEETWMPAWGVRTALTALRSFMAEAGTAGQVGGLESSDEVRQKLATDSKKWRCSECGKSNTEIMEQWWIQCRDQGVKVDEEDLGLEALPDGMSVEAIDRSKGKSKETESSVQAASQQPTGSGVESSADQVTSQLHAKSSGKAISNLEPTNTDTKPLPTPTTSIQQSTNDVGTSTSSSISSQQHPQQPILRNTSHPQQQTQTQTQTHTHAPTTQTRPNHENQAITLDRAITVIFLALCLMILKKIFYSSSSSGYGTNDDWEIGLSREY